MQSEFIGSGMGAVFNEGVRDQAKGKVFVLEAAAQSSSVDSASSSSSAPSDSHGSSRQTHAAATAASAAAMDTACSSSQPSAAAAAASLTSSAGAQPEADAAQKSAVHVAPHGTVISLSNIVFDGVSVGELSELTAQMSLMRICEAEKLAVKAVEVSKSSNHLGVMQMSARIAFDSADTAQRARIELKDRAEFKNGVVSVCKSNRLTTRIAYRGRFISSACHCLCVLLLSLCRLQFFLYTHFHLSTFACTQTTLVAQHRRCLHRSSVASPSRSIAVGARMLPIRPARSMRPAYRLAHCGYSSGLTRLAIGLSSMAVSSIRSSAASFGPTM